MNVKAPILPPFPFSQKSKQASLDIVHQSPASSPLSALNVAQTIIVRFWPFRYSTNPLPMIHS